MPNFVMNSNASSLFFIQFILLFLAGCEAHRRVRKGLIVNSLLEAHGLISETLRRETFLKFLTQKMFISA